MPALSVIMSLYHGDELQYVKAATESVLAQTYSDYTYHIIIDGDISHDIDEYINSLNDPRIRLSRHEENKGLAVSMNDLLKTVLKEADCQYIARMDADDMCASTRFEEQIKYMDSHKECDCLGTWAVEIDADGKEYFRKEMPCRHEECFRFFSKRDCMIHPTVMFRRSYFEKAGLYPEDTYFGEDTIMWAQGFAAGCHFANLPDFLYYFRLNDNFFKRRRGFKHSMSILKLRYRVNKMLHYGALSYIYAFLYAVAKLMPEKLLNVIYKTAR